jgi:hypothetical protein
VMCPMCWSDLNQNHKAFVRTQNTKFTKIRLVAVALMAGQRPTDRHDAANNRFPQLLCECTWPKATSQCVVPQSDRQTDRHNTGHCVIRTDGRRTPWWQPSLMYSVLRNVSHLGAPFCRLLFQSGPSLPLSQHYIVFKL